MVECSEKDAITSTLGHYNCLLKCVINRVWKCHITLHIHFICCLNILLLEVPLIYVVLNFACFKLNVDANACLDPYDELHFTVLSVAWHLVCFTFCSHCVLEFDTPELVRLCQSDWQPWAKKTTNWSKMWVKQRQKAKHMLSFLLFPDWPLQGFWGEWGGKLQRCHKVQPCNTVLDWATPTYTLNQLLAGGQREIVQYFNTVFV